MTWHEFHLGQFSHIPGTDDEPSAIGIGFDLFDEIRHLVYFHPSCTFPAPPLFTIHRAQVAVFIGPLIPDFYIMLFQVGNIGISF